MWFDIMFWTLKSLPQNMFWYPIMGDDYIRRRGNLRRRSSSSSSFKIFFRWLGTPFWGMYSSTCIHRPFWQSTTRAIKGQHPICLLLLLPLLKRQMQRMKDCDMKRKTSPESWIRDEMRESAELICISHRRSTTTTYRLQIHLFREN